MEEENLYIPMGLKEEDEYWQGFGRKELIETAIAASIMFYTKDYTNLSIYDQVRNMMDFKKSQKIYEYKYLDEWQC